MNFLKYPKVPLVVNAAVTSPNSPGKISPLVKSEIVQLQPGSTRMISMGLGPRFSILNLVLAGSGAFT